LANLPGASGIGIDRSRAALEVAAANAVRLNLEGRARMLRADWDIEGWWRDLGGPFDLVLANPPYVENAADLSPSVREYEPAGALFAGPDGLGAYRALIPRIAGLL